MASYGASSTYVLPKRQPRYDNNDIKETHAVSYKIVWLMKTDQARRKRFVDIWRSCKQGVPEP